MRFEFIEVPQIEWRGATFKERMALRHGWSLVGRVEDKKRFRLYWDTADSMTRLKDNCTGRTADFVGGSQRAAIALAKAWFEESA